MVKCGYIFCEWENVLITVSQPRGQIATHDEYNGKCTRQMSPQLSPKMLKKLSFVILKINKN